MASELQRALALDYEISDRVSQRSYLAYLDRVVIDSRPNPQRFGKVARPFQWERARTLAPAVEYVAGLQNSYTGPLNFFYTLPKGSDKSSGMARLCNWALGYSKKRLKIYVAASDSDQGRIIRDLQQAELDLNPWLKKRVNLLYKAGWGKGGQVEFLASDASSAQGLAPDILLLDEVCHWHKRDLFDALFSARNKRPNCVTIICTNAGYVGHFSYEIREHARQSSRWYFYESPPFGNLASWMDAAAIAEDRKLLHPAEASRLLDNKWQDTSNDISYLAADEINRCLDPELRLRQQGSRSTQYFGSIDYGPKRDRTAICINHREPDGTVVIDRLECWHRPGGTVMVEEVEQFLDKANVAFNSPLWTVDGYQMEGTIQKFESRGFRIDRFEPRGGKSNYEMAANLRSLIVSKRMKWYPNCGPVTFPRKFEDPAFPVADLADDTLEKELSSLVIKITSTGYRFDHVSNKHDDRAVAVGMAALAAVNTPLAPPLAAPIAVQTEPRDLRNLPFASQRGLFGVR